ncbi:MerR family DNA-binding transcriptional regulator [Nocardioides sp.]|uniref:MerR family DNA-binding transcriptional regulator n=1 Tax=Nocardioides sp. TaxID=35761 RepID=UPI002C42806E|nr:MerR family DNA-binding transcriptional regulator [Nocardioides sp.]HVX53591.1 MerR family DNA-binding transcriptional regulator [Nocardioides sp.]
MKEAAALTALPASTLRYYESIGMVAPISRGSSRHRVCDEDDLDQLMWVACLAATGMPVSGRRQYVANRELGPDTAAAQIGLLAKQDRRLTEEAERRPSRSRRQRYVRLKIDYWRAVHAGERGPAERLSTEACALADGLK